MDFWEIFVCLGAFDGFFCVLLPVFLFEVFRKLVKLWEELFVFFGVLFGVFLGKGCLSSSQTWEEHCFFCWLVGVVLKMCKNPIQNIGFLGLLLF